MRDALTEATYTARSKGIARSPARVDFDAIGNKLAALHNAWATGDIATNKGSRTVLETNFKDTLSTYTKALEKETAYVRADRPYRGEYDLWRAFDHMNRMPL